MMVAPLISLQLLLRTMLVCWATIQLLCYPLWHGLRDYPIIPIWDVLLKLPWFLHDTLFYGGLGCMLLLLWKPNKRWAMILLVVTICGALLDQNRWQPWHYQFIWMLAAYVFLQKEKQVILAWQIILVSVYFFSGLAKLQSAFIHDIWKNLFLQSWLGITAKNQWILRLGYVMPIAEMGFALLLLTGSFKKIGVYGLILMHLLILIWLGPFARNTIIEVWPWNIAMPFFLVALFYQRKLEPMLAFFKIKFVRLLLLACCILPWLNLGGYWDRNLSFVMYSGGVPLLYICTNNNTVLMQYASYMSNHKSAVLPCKFPIPVYQWALKTIHTSPNTEKRVYAAIVKQWKQLHLGVEASFYIYKSGFKYTLVKFDPQ
ncbi:MAG: hypothetical protein WEA59_08750 [Ferruginibacter sp.]